VGIAENTACYRLAVIVPYRALRPDFSGLGSSLIAAVRKPL